MIITQCEIESLDSFMAITNNKSLTKTIGVEGTKTNAIYDTGATSTFLAVALLGASQSYVFIAMFKQFFLTVLFGVMHGLVFLPTMLIYLGPPSQNDDGVSGAAVVEIMSKA